ncbi:hypothetical protein J0H58_27920 [bacterium]|nr:hypothetical protein [bacterium]
MNTDTRSGTTRLLSPGGADGTPTAWAMAVSAASVDRPRAGAADRRAALP